MSAQSSLELGVIWLLWLVLLVSSLVIVLLVTSHILIYWRRESLETSHAAICLGIHRLLIAPHHVWVHHLLSWHHVHLLLVELVGILLVLHLSHVRHFSHVWLLVLLISLLSV